MIGTDRLDVLVTGLSQEEATHLSLASSLRPTLSTNAAAADIACVLPDEVVTAMHKAGLFRLATPRVYGGVQAGSRAVTAIAAEVARECPSAAWVLTVFYSGGLAAWMFPEAVQQRIWQADPDAAVCGSSGGGARVTPVDNGYLLNGRWGWASGAHHASWIILDVVGESTADRGIALVPMRDLSIEKTWNMVGMRGTGSDTVVADDVHVPEDQVLFLSRMTMSPTGGGLPRPQGLDSTLSGTILGIGLGVYDHVVDGLTQGLPRSPKANPRHHKVDAPGVQAGVADAAMLIDSAILLVARSAGAVDRATGTGQRLSAIEETRVRMDGGLAARQIRAAVDTLLDLGGAGRLAESSPAQRLWRDMGTAMRHPAFVQEATR
ncbi:hypothetical protein JIG36_50910 [Actinoplanes sp. LDG1-06]|uniref:Acyl-CoA dehydrogenase n=1 Tax=Paractinoplanes ovalisporus TaxID=2810368 RepID=A0ABS2AVS7_9ACTN|nr:acyl-CoA dehydrogenase family protein [Actinoplanes ovalisporus]MBM2623830.1 hypothetical protein [Actinoplanes ovalisporus]